MSDYDPSDELMDVYDRANGEGQDELDHGEIVLLCRDCVAVIDQEQAENADHRCLKCEQHHNNQVMAELNRTQEYHHDRSPFYMNPVDLGRWDDDPSPYDGTYSEE